MTIDIIHLRRYFMKKTLTVAVAMALIFAAANAYAGGEKCKAAKAEASKAKAELTTNSDGTCHSDVKAMNADAKAGTPDAKAMNAGANGCASDGKAMNANTGACGSRAKAMTADVQKADAKVANCPVTPGCCDTKVSKASNASQKAEMTEEKKDANPVLIISAPVEVSSK
jgi:hypothetical protein